MSKEQWRKVKEAEKNKSKGKNLGQTGITSFKSRTFAEWQRAGGKSLSCGSQVCQGCKGDSIHATSRWYARRLRLKERREVRRWYVWLYAKEKSTRACA